MSDELWQGHELAVKCGYVCPSPDDCDFPTCQCSDTPRTDAALAIEGSAAGKAFGFVDANFARQLERELNDLRAAADTLAGWAEDQKKEIARLRDLFYGPPTT